MLLKVQQFSGGQFFFSLEISFQKFQVLYLLSSMGSNSICIPSRRMAEETHR